MTCTNQCASMSFQQAGVVCERNPESPASACVNATLDHQHVCVCVCVCVSE